MATGRQVANAFDHPVMFSFVIALTTIAWCALLTWGAKAAGYPGLAALTQHP